MNSELRVQFVSSYQGVSDYIYDHTRRRVQAAWDHETSTYYVADAFGAAVVEQYQADQRADWDRWVSRKSAEDRATFGPYPTRAVVIDPVEWEARVYPYAVTR